jgi:hypothetical protein
MCSKPKNQSIPYFNATFNDESAFSIIATETGIDVSFSTSTEQWMTFLESNRVLHRNMATPKGRYQNGPFELSRLFLPNVIL